MAPREKAEFQDFVVKRMTTVTGGLLRKPAVVQVLDIKVGHETFDFVHLNTKQDWLCKAVTGEGASSRPMKRVKLLQTIQQKLKSRVQGDDDDEVNCEVAPAVAADDPMLGLDMGGPAEPEGPGQGKDKGKKKVSSKRNVVRVNTVLRLLLPERCPEQHPECKELREVPLWVKNKREIWLGLDHLKWAMEIMYHQHKLGGISAVPSEEFASPAVAGVGAGSSPSSSSDGDSSPSRSVAVKWCFHVNAWKATVTENGQVVRERALKPANTEADEASTVMDSAAANLQDMKYSELKNVAFKVLQRWGEMQ